MARNWKDAVQEAIRNAASGNSSFRPDPAGQGIDAPHTDDEPKAGSMDMEANRQRASRRSGVRDGSARITGQDVSAPSFGGEKAQASLPTKKSADVPDSGAGRQAAGGNKVEYGTS
jgi:hypothetical protein